MLGEPDRAEVEVEPWRAPVYAIRESKIHPPQLQADILKRDRLLDWIAVKVNRRAVFVVAEAGFGKTTLLADFLRRTHIRGAWYRLDEEESDGLAFLRYFVAACRVADPALLPRCAALLADTATSPVGWQTVLSTLLAELAPLGDEPTAIFFDDYHLAEHVPAIREIVEQLVTRAPDRLSFVFASRRTPRLPVARLRARDELAELTREELCFETSETEELFRETYQQPLEPDVLQDLQARTEGWPASLQLVKQALRRRTPTEIRSFVRTLNGAEGVLYDFLAEEVVADLPEDLRMFLLRASLLEDVEAEVAGPALGLSIGDTTRLIEEAEALGLLSRVRVSTRPARFHPLVKDFLFASLRHEIGEEAIRELHRQIARLEESRSWRRAAHHWGEAGDAASVRRVIEESTHIILGSGEYKAAEELIDHLGATEPNAYFDMIRSRLAFARGRIEEGTALASQASELVAATESPSDHLIRLDGLNRLFAAAKGAYDFTAVQAAVVRITAGDLDEEARALAKSLATVHATVGDADFDEAERALEDVAALSKTLGRLRNEGIAYVNLAGIARAKGEMDRCVLRAQAAIGSLTSAGAADELACAHLYKALAEAHRGEWDVAQTGIAAALAISRDSGSLLLAAEVYALYGDSDVCLRLLDEASDSAPGDWRHTLANVFRLRMRPFEAGDFDALFKAAIKQAVPWCGYESTVAAYWAYVAAVLSAPTAPSLLEEALALTEAKHTRYYSKTTRLVQASRFGIDHLQQYIQDLETADLGYLSVAAELLLGRWEEMAGPTRCAIREAIRRHPARWRSAARACLRVPTADVATKIGAARVLDLIGTAEDIPGLRRMARDPRVGCVTLGKALIRRVAPIVSIDDLGPVSITVGDRAVSPTDIRRKVLAFTTFLITRHRFAATCEEVLEALWPGLDETVGMNSLNQTVYFLRRVIEPRFSEHTTPGYVRHEGEVVSLDEELVTSRSGRCLDLIRRIGRNPSSRELIAELQSQYTGRFALDFAYEDWAAGYREHLHAAYLSIVEKAVTTETNRGKFDDAIAMAQRAIEVDPDADQIEVSLLRLYKRTGAYSAAAEQYGHYAAAVREQLGVEPPPLEAL